MTLYIEKEKNMMKHFHKFLSLALALMLCLSLAACGGEDENSAAPTTIENMVMDDSIECDYSVFLGTWLDADSNVLLVEELNGRTRFDLSDTNNKLLASGEFQYSEEYGYVYAYNEHDGIAHQCWFDEDNALHIDSFGTFTKVSGDMPGETVGNEADCTVLAGTWYLDGDVNSASSLEIDGTGTIWSLYERSADGEWSEVDYGTVRAVGENEYEAVSDSFEDVIYDLYLADENAMYWGGENDYYGRV